MFQTECTFNFFSWGNHTVWGTSVKNNYAVSGLRHDTENSDIQLSTPKPNAVSHSDWIRKYENIWFLFYVCAF